MKRYFLLSCLSGMLATSMSFAQPTIDLGPGIVASEGSGAASGPAAPPAPGLGERVSDAIGPRTEPAAPCVSNDICVGPGACATGGCRTTGEQWERFKNWLCYRSDSGKLLPCLRPTPYRPPLYNWFPCQEGCATGCGPQGCGGPPISYYYPTKQHPAPAPKVELRGPQTLPNGQVTARAPEARKPTSLIPGLRFAFAETPGVPDKKRNTGVTPATAVTSNAPAATAARPGDVPFGFHQTSLKKADLLP